MAWDDTPLYERNSAPKAVSQYLKTPPNAENSGVAKRSVPWASEVLGRGFQTGAPSPLYSWFFREYDKRWRGQDNEIDRAEIVQAAKGVRNKWTDRYLADPKKFESIVRNSKDAEKVNWADISAPPKPKIEPPILTKPQPVETNALNSTDILDTEFQILESRIENKEVCPENDNGYDLPF